MIVIVRVIGCLMFKMIARTGQGYFFRQQLRIIISISNIFLVNNIISIIIAIISIIIISIISIIIINRIINIIIIIIKIISSNQFRNFERTTNRRNYACVSERFLLEVFVPSKSKPTPLLWYSIVFLEGLKTELGQNVVTLSN